MAEEPVWPTQQRLALCNILEDTPNQHWPNISRIMRQFALNSNMLEEPSVHAVAKDCISQQDLLIRDYEPIIKKLLGPNETLVDLKLKASTYTPIAASLRKDRLKELKTSIRLKENQIRALRREMKEIQQGKRDAQLLPPKSTSAMDVDDETASSSSPRAASSSPRKADTKELMAAFMDAISSNKHASSFLEPAAGSPAALAAASKIKQPVYIETITREIENGTIATRYQLVRKLFLMCKNVTVGSPIDSDLHNAGFRFRDVITAEAEHVFGADIFDSYSDSGSSAKARSKAHPRSSK